MSRLTFLSPHEAAIVGASPLQDLRSRTITDVSSLGKLEVRGDVAALNFEVIPLGPRRALLVVDDDVRPLRNRLQDEGYRVYDRTAALAAFEISGERLMRRITALNLRQLPAVGAILRDTPAVIEGRGAARFRLFVPQELSRSVALAIDDLAEGLEA